MQRFDVRETQEIAVRGRYLRWDTDSGNPIAVRAAGIDLGQVYPGELLELPDVVDKWTITPQPGETGFVRVGMNRVDSDRKNPQSRLPVVVITEQVAPARSGAPGWLSGSSAGVPAGQQNWVMFDLGEEWAQYSLIGIQTCVVGSPVSAWFRSCGGPDLAQTQAQRLGAAYSQAEAAQQNVNSASGEAVWGWTRPAGRYFKVYMSNNASAATQPGTLIRLHLYPG